MNNTIPLIFSSSNEFVPYLSVCLISLKEHLSQLYEYKIFILENDINEINKSTLRDIFKNTNVYIEFINTDKYTKNIHFFAHDHVSEHTFFKLLIPKIFTSYEKVLFCDADIIFQSNPAELFETNIANKKIAASLCHLWNAIIHKNKKAYNYTVNELSIKNPDKYFQGGILLFNIKQITTQDVKNLLNIATKKEYTCLDQDVLNHYFQEDVTYIDSRWNYETPQKGFLEFIPYMQENHLSKWQNAQKNPHIIHFSGKEKPWLYPEEAYADIWWKYAKLSPFYEIIIKNMVSQTIKHNIEIHNAIQYFNINCLNYWKYKFLQNFSYGNAKEKIKGKKLELKQKIRLAKAVKE